METKLAQNNVTPLRRPRKAGGDGRQEIRAKRNRRRIAFRDHSGRPIVIMGLVIIAVAGFLSAAGSGNLTSRLAFANTSTADTLVSLVFDLRRWPSHQLRRRWRYVLVQRRENPHCRYRHTWLNAMRGRTNTPSCPAQRRDVLAFDRLARRGRVWAQAPYRDPRGHSLGSHSSMMACEGVSPSPFTTSRISSPI